MLSAVLTAYILKYEHVAVSTNKYRQVSKIKMWKHIQLIQLNGSYIVSMCGHIYFQRTVKTELYELQ